MRGDTRADRDLGTAAKLEQEAATLGRLGGGGGRPLAEAMQAVAAVAHMHNAARAQGGTRI